jgi:glycerol-3-phosphate dehydrogenase subunit C
VSYHVPCHLRVQRIGLKTRDALKLVPGTTVEVIERCSGHNGTYAVKREFHEHSVRIGRPVVQRVAAGRRPLLERLPDGRRPDRARPGGQGAGSRAPAEPAAAGVWNLRSHDGQ